MLASAAMQCLSPLMYERSDIRDFFKMVNAELLDLGIREVLGEYGLDNYRKAWDEAADSGRICQGHCDEAIKRYGVVRLY